MTRSKTEYPKIDSLEAPLRAAHEHVDGNITFQNFVVAIRRSPAHPLHEIAVEYNREVYEMQRNWRG